MMMVDISDLNRTPQQLKKGSDEHGEKQGI